MKGALIARSVGVGILASIVYGIVHDQITIRICPEYFTVWHPQLTESTNLTYVALLWGVAATWWMGAIFGLVLGLASTLGDRQPAPTLNVIKVISSILVASAILATVAGVLTRASGLEAPSFVMGAKIAGYGEETRRSFTVDLAIHNASYSVSAFGAVVGAWWIWRGRKVANTG